MGDVITLPDVPAHYEKTVRNWAHRLAQYKATEAAAMLVRNAATLPSPDPAITQALQTLTPWSPGLPTQQARAQIVAYYLLLAATPLNGFGLRGIAASRLACLETAVEQFLEGRP